MAQDNGSNEIFVSALDGTKSDGGTHGENRSERLEDLECSATKSSAAGIMQSHASKILCSHLVLSMLLAI